MFQDTDEFLVGVDPGGQTLLEYLDKATAPTETLELSNPNKRQKEKNKKKGEDIRGRWCLTLPRLFFGPEKSDLAKVLGHNSAGDDEKWEQPRYDDRLMAAAARLDSLTYRTHACPGGFAYNKYPKQIADVSRIPLGLMRQKPVTGPHFIVGGWVTKIKKKAPPFPENEPGSCPDATSAGGRWNKPKLVREEIRAAAAGGPPWLRFHHYLGPYERYRRFTKLSTWKNSSLMSCNDKWARPGSKSYACGSNNMITSWFGKFVELVGAEKAAGLLAAPEA
jgi:hypothetical protein